MRHYFFLILIALSFFSCTRKELPIPVNSDPVFKFIGTIGGDSIRYQGGVDHMYMYSGYFKDPQNLMTIKSYFGKDNCSNCEPYLSFEIKDFEVSSTNGLAGTIAQLIQAGGPTFNSFSLDSILTATNVEAFTFFPENNSVGATYKWDFGDGGTSTLMSPTYIFADSGGMKTVRLIISKGGLIDTVTNIINTDFASPCRAQFNTISDSMTNKITVTSFTPGFTYAWDYGDGNTGSGQTDTNTYTSGGKYTITLTATAPACTSVFKRKVNISSFFTTLANYIYQTSITAITSMVPRINKSAFIITYKKNGIKYNSYKNVHGINQSGNPVFTFTGIQVYHPNEHGDPTMMVTGTVDTYLFNENNWTDSIKIRSNEIVLAAAYPQ